MRSWLPSTLDERVMRVICAALDDVGEHEWPPGSNSGPYVDALNAATGSPPKSFWCANAVTSWVRRGPLWTPERDQGSCEAWRRAALETGRLDSRRRLGDVVLYGATPTHASHCGLIVCLDPPMCVQGNTTLDGYSRDGIAVQCKLLTAEHVLGYVHLLAA